MKRNQCGEIANMEWEENKPSESSALVGETIQDFPARLVLTKAEDDLRKPPSSLILLNKPKVTIGRHLNVDYCIVSPGISRLHCEIKACSGTTDEWEVIDRSINGVYINGIKIEKDLGHKLNDGDIINLGWNENPVVSYVFKGKVERAQTPFEKHKRLKPEPQLPEPTQSTSLASDADVLLPSATQGVSSTAMPTQQPETGATPERLELRRKNDELTEQLERMRDLMKSNEIALRQQWELEQEEKKKVEEAAAEAAKREEALEEQKWQERMTELSDKHASALEEKNQLVERLKAMSESKSKEAEIEREKARLEEELSRKSEECTAMKEKLNELTSRNEESAALAIKIREDLIQNVNDTMENELQCSICSELFVKAATLNCAHSYCSYCINEWKQKKPECPICRQKITSITPSLVLDNFIEKIVDSLNTSMKERRKELLEERKKLPVQNVARNTVIINIDASPQARQGSNRGTRPQRRRVGGRGTQPRLHSHQATLTIQNQVRLTQGGVTVHRMPSVQRGTGRGTMVQVAVRPQLRSILPAQAPANNDILLRHPNPFPLGVQPIEISSESQSDDEEAAVPMPFGYYGGHGFCYRCGRSGHWANGCPY